MNESSDDPLVGKRISNRYRITRVQGLNLHAVFCSGEDLENKSNVDLIIIQQDSIKDPKSLLKRLEALCRLKHKNILTAIDSGITDSGEYFLALPGIRGRTLCELGPTIGPLGAAETETILLSLSRALSYLRSAGEKIEALHPKQIKMFGTAGDANAKLVHLQTLGLLSSDSALEFEPLSELDKAEYLPPELFSNASYDERAQIYSLGLICYSLLMGKKPFSGETSLELQSLHQNTSPPPFRELRPDTYISPRIEVFVNRCLQKDPLKRPQTIVQFEKELRLAFKTKASWPIRLRDIACLLLALVLLMYFVLPGIPSLASQVSNQEPLRTILAFFVPQAKTPDNPIPENPEDPAFIPPLPADAKDLGHLLITGNELKVLESGNYKANDLRLFENACLKAQGPVSIWILDSDGETKVKSALRLTGKARLDGQNKDNRIKIYYAGTRPIELFDSAYLYADLKAPSALVCASNQALLGGPLMSQGQKLEDDARFVDPGNF